MGIESGEKVMKRVAVEIRILKKWKCVNFVLTPGDVIWAEANFAEELIEGGFAEKVSSH
jgi:hypothetical protein